MRHTRWHTEAKLAIVFTYFSLSFFLSFFFSYAFCFSPTSGNLPCVKICFPQYFVITRRYMQKNIFLGYFIFLRKKLIFGRFVFFSQPAFGHGIDLLLGLKSCCLPTADIGSGLFLWMLWTIPRERIVYKVVTILWWCNLSLNWDWHLEIREVEGGHLFVFS